MHEQIEGILFSDPWSARLVFQQAPRLLSVFETGEACRMINSYCREQVASFIRLISLDVFLGGSKQLFRKYLWLKQLLDLHTRDAVNITCM